MSAFLTWWKNLFGVGELPQSNPIEFELWPLSEILRGAPSSTYILNLEQKRIAGPTELVFDQVKAVEQVDFELDRVRLYSTVLKFVPGPYLCLKPIQSRVDAERVAIDLAVRFGKKTRQMMQGHKLALNPTLKTLERKKLVGKIDLLDPQSVSGGICLPVMLATGGSDEINAIGSLVFKRDEIRLFDCDGNHAQVCRQESITNWEVTEKTLMFSGSECESLSLNLELEDSSFRFSLTFGTREVHDDFVPGESRRADTELQLAHRTLESIRQVLQPAPL